MIRTLEPDEAVFEVASDKFKDAWEQRTSQFKVRRRALETGCVKLDDKIQQLLQKVVQVRSPVVMATFEERIEGRQNQKLLIEERIKNSDQPTASFDQGLGTALAFLRSP